MSLQDIHDIYAEPHIKSVEISVSDGTTLGNKDIVTEKFELQDSLNSANELVFGSCEAACLKLQVAAEPNRIYKDLWLDVWATIQDNSGDLMIDNEHYLLMSDGSKMRMHPYISSTRVGRFKVVLDEPVSDRSWRNLTCYDQMYDILRTEVSEWYNTLTFPMTVKAFRDSFFAYLEIEQEDVALINDDLNIMGNFVATSKLTGRPIIKAICEINGVFGHMNKDGKMDYISIPSDESVEYPYYRDGTGSYERDLVEPITGIIARDSEDDVGTTVGTTVNPYIITGNPLVFGIEGTQELEDALTALLAKIGGITYRPFAVTSFGNPALPIGTSIILNTRDITIESFIETRRLTGVQGLKDTISAKGNKERLNDTIDLSSELYQTEGRYHLLRNDVNGLESEVFDEQGNSKIEQISNEIVLKVDSNGKIVNVELTAEPTGSAFKVLADNIDFISNGKIQLTSKSLEINSTNFSVTSAGSITAKAGSIGGWSITTNALYNGMTSLSDTTHDGVWIGQDGIALGKGKFKVTNAGAMSASNLSITGGSINLGSGVFQVTNAGAVTASNLSITGGGINLGSGKFTVSNAGAVSASNITVTGGSITLGTTFSVTSAGALTATSGSVGGWSLSGSSFSYGGSYLSRSGSIRLRASSTSTNGVELSYDGLNWFTASGSTLIQYSVLSKYNNKIHLQAETLSISGSKSRVVNTEDYGKRLLYCYETPTPMFGDLGESIIAEDGKCYIMTESIFAQTIADASYQVFLQKYGEGECYVTDRKANYFVVEGTVGLKFGWEIKAKQAGYEMRRLDADIQEANYIGYDYGSYSINDLPSIDYGDFTVEESYYGSSVIEDNDYNTYEIEEEINYGMEAIQHFYTINKEREVA